MEDKIKMIFNLMLFSVTCIIIWFSRGDTPTPLPPIGEMYSKNAHYGLSAQVEPCLAGSQNMAWWAGLAESPGLLGWTRTLGPVKGS